MGFLDNGGGADLNQVEDNTPSEETASYTQEEQSTSTNESSKPTGRRAQAKAAQDAVLNELKTLRESFTTRDQEFRNEIERRDRELAELRGGFQAIQPILQQRQEPPKPPAPDSAELNRKAREALDAGKFEDYDRYKTEALKADLLNEIQKRVPQQQQERPQPGVDPRLQIIMMQHPTVAMNPRGIELARLKDQELAIMGIADSPDRWKKAFELAENSINGGKPTQPQYSQSAAQVLSSIPTSRSGANTQEANNPASTLTDAQKYWADASGMSREEYAKILNAAKGTEP